VPPQEPPPSAWNFRPPEPHAGEVVSWGGDLLPGTLLAAYRAGIFPMPLDAGRMGWWSPEPRGVIPLDGLRVRRSLRRSSRHFEIRVDTAFGAVVAACARVPRPHGWITEEIESAYGRLHEAGWAHSVETWRDGELAGGLYGVAVGGLFAGESMFHRERDASKVALLALVDLLSDGDPSGAAAAGRLLDVQWSTPHLASLGAVTVPRTVYLRRLQRALQLPLPGRWRPVGEAAPAPPPAPGEVGLCASCVHARQVPGARTVFWRCSLADTDATYARYPRLPVLECAGYQASSAERATSIDDGRP
jgi:leucyl/phenylalanyl-tRNA--protein transferase